MQQYILCIFLTVLKVCALVNGDNKCRGFGKEINPGQRYDDPTTKGFIACSSYSDYRSEIVDRQTLETECSGMSDSADTESAKEFRQGRFQYKCGKRPDGSYFATPMACYNPWNVRKEPASTHGWWLDDGNNLIWSCEQDGSANLKIVPTDCYFFRDIFDQRHVDIGCFHVEKRQRQPYALLACERRSPTVIQRTDYRYSAEALQDLSQRGLNEC